MSQVSRANGFTPVKYLNGAAYNGAFGTYFVPASDGTAFGVGDLVKLAGDARNPTGVPTIAKANAGDTIVGVVIGFAFTGEGDVQNMPPVNDLNTPVYRRASTDRYVFVADDPNLIYEAQVDTGASFTTADVGLNINFTANAVSATTGLSTEVLTIATKATTATLPLKIYGFPNRPDNNIGTDPFVRIYVLPNAHTYKTGAGIAVGV